MQGFLMRLWKAKGHCTNSDFCFSAALKSSTAPTRCNRSVQHQHILQKRGPNQPLLCPSGGIHQPPETCSDSTSPVRSPPELAHALLTALLALTQQLTCPPIPNKRPAQRRSNRMRPSSVQKQRKALFFDQRMGRWDLMLQSTLSQQARLGLL